MKDRKTVTLDNMEIAARLVILEKQVTNLALFVRALRYDVLDSDPSIVVGSEDDTTTLD